MTMPSLTTRRCAQFVIGILASSAPVLAGGMPPDYGFQWATITHPGNAPYSVPPNIGQPRTVGRVDYVYRISKTEMSAADWAPFANANLRIGDPWEIGLEAYFGQMLDIGPGGVLQPRTDIPAGDRLNLGSVTWYDAARYCNWLHNGKTETREAMEYGAYDLRHVPANPPSNITPPTRLPGATFFIPTGDEWVKAVHFDPNRYGTEQPGYWDYPYSSNLPPVPGPVGVGTTNAGYFPDGTDPLAFRVGAYSDVVAPWGLLDASGGRSEWLETPSSFGLPTRGYDGFASGRLQSPNDLSLDHTARTGQEIPHSRWFWLGFRVASIPAPGHALIWVGLGAWLHRRTKRRPAS
ncbi:MAG: SUMF1/EgtB/PvdO family nonheme iron enzyme [Phycisphaerales bacterium]